MLNHLLDYARSRSLQGQLGFAKDHVRWVVPFDRAGNFLGEVIGLTNDSKANGDLFTCPRLPQPLLKAGGAGTRHFLCDSTAVATLLGLEKLDESDQEKLRAKHNFFVGLLGEAATECDVIAGLAAALTRESVVTSIRESLVKQKPTAKPTQNITFFVDNRNLLEVDDWHVWYSSFVAKLVAAKEAKTKKKAGVMCSLVSGTQITAAKTHPMLRGLSDIGGNATVALASFKPPAFTHYGLRQSENAAVSSEEAETYVAAANELIRNSRTLAMGKVVYWYTGPTQDTEPIDVIGTDLFGDEDGDAPAAELTRDQERTLDQIDAAQGMVAARRLLCSMEDGTAPPELKNWRFVAISIGANASRLVLRDQMEGSFEQLLKSINTWFDDLEVTKLDVRRPANPPKLLRVITAALPPKSPKQKYKDWIKPVTKLREPFWRLALQHNPAKQDRSVPLAAIEQLLPTLRASILNGEFEEAISGAVSARSRLYARMGLLKIFVKRNGDINVSTYLNENHPDAAYQYGRLLAVLANIQEQALGDVGANIVQRYYARASTAPADAIGPIVRLSNAHLSKLDKGLAVFLRDKVARILNRIDTTNEESLPSTLNATRQGLFALGYYQQIAQDRQEMLANASKKRAENAQSEKRESK